MNFFNVDNNDLLLANLGFDSRNYPNLSISTSSNECIKDCQNISTNSNDTLHNLNDDFYTQINSQYYDILEFNQINHHCEFSFKMLHTNLASISKHWDDLQLTLSLLKTKFDVIGITEHKIQKDKIASISNIDIPGFHSFVFDCSDTSGTGLYIRDSLVYNKRDDLKILSSGNIESTFIEIIFPEKKNMIIGCVYRHPSSSLSIQTFNEDIFDPLLDKIASGDKTCALMGDFNIDLLKADTNDNTNKFFNNLTSHFCTPFVLQPTRLSSKTVIDNIFLNTIEYPSYSGNLTVQLSDHLFQFVILEGFHKELISKRTNIYERNFKNFSEHEFQDIMKSTGWNNILMIDKNDPNHSMNNLHLFINNILDILAPYKKLSKKELKLKTKQWINNETLFFMNKR